MILASFAEVISIGALLPFLGALTTPDVVFSHPYSQPLINLLSLTEPKQILLPFTVIFGVGALIAGAMRLLLLWVQTRLSHAIGADLSASIYRRTLYQPYAVHLSRNSSEIIAGVRSKASNIVQSIVIPFMTIVSSVLMLIAILVTLLMIDPVIASSAFIGFAFIYLLIIMLTKKALLRSSIGINEDQNYVIKALQEGLGGIRDVLIDGTQATYCNIYSKADVRLRRAEANVQIIGSSPRFGIEALGMVLIAALSYSLSIGPSGILKAIPVLGALALGAQRLLPVLQGAYSGWSSMLGVQASLSDTLDLLDQPLPAYADAPLLAPMPFHSTITLNDIAFKYTESADWVLKHGFNLSVKKGDRIGFIGTTGSGKSTLLDIIMGLLQPTEGAVLVDGIKITEQNQRGWQEHIAHVPQAIFLADTSIAENIAFGTILEEIDHVRMRQSAQKAQIAQTIESLDKQYNTLVGEQGVRLSGGQRQRIGVARALYKEADVIVLDEATSALDNDTELDVMGAIKNLGNDITVLIVAHRLTTLKNCTQIVEIVDGKIAQIGSYKEIVERVAL